MRCEGSVARRGHGDVVATFFDRRCPAGLDPLLNCGNQFLRKPREFFIQLHAPLRAQHFVERLCGLTHYFQALHVIIEFHQGFPCFRFLYPRRTLATEFKKLAEFERRFTLAKPAKFFVATKVLTSRETSGLGLRPACRTRASAARSS